MTLIEQETLFEASSTVKLQSAVAELLGAETATAIYGAFDLIDWAEDEIKRAQKRWPDQADRLFHAFPLLRPMPDVRIEFVVRSHYREMLYRIATGKDTREATNAELALICCNASQQAPMTTAGVTLYFRVFQRAFPDKQEQIFGGQRQHYEAVAGQQADELERQVRRRAYVPSRVMPPVTCEGKHWGRPAPNCPIYTKGKG